MLTRRSFWILLAVALAPGAIAAIGHALQLNGPVLNVLVAVAWVGCVATVTHVACGWRAR
jgi:hypothetical protein